MVLLGRPLQSDRSSGRPRRAAPVGRLTLRIGPPPFPTVTKLTGRRRSPTWSTIRGDGRSAICEPLDSGTLTDLEQILLGLLASNPRSGYERKRFFATTLTAAYQPISGTLYPPCAGSTSRDRVP